jgi:hypothetical protein
MSTAMFTEREELLGCYSDFHKDAYGFRPRGVNIMAMTDAELLADIQKFSAIADANYEAEVKREQADLIRFNTLVEQTIAMGANDRRTALKWLFDGSEITVYSIQDIEHFVWSYGILFTDTGKALVQELIPIVKELQPEQFN